MDYDRTENEKQAQIHIEKNIKVVKRMRDQYSKEMPILDETIENLRQRLADLYRES